MQLGNGRLSNGTWGHSPTINGGWTNKNDIVYIHRAGIIPCISIYMQHDAPIFQKKLFQNQYPRCFDHINHINTYFKRSSPNCSPNSASATIPWIIPSDHPDWCHPTCWARRATHPPRGSRAPWCASAAVSPPVWWFARWHWDCHHDHLGADMEERKTTSRHHRCFSTILRSSGDDLEPYFRNPQITPACLFASSCPKHPWTFQPTNPTPPEIQCPVARHLPSNCSPLGLTHPVANLPLQLVWDIDPIGGSVLARLSRWFPQWPTLVVRWIFGNWASFFIQLVQFHEQMWNTSNWIIWLCCSCFLEWKVPHNLAAVASS